VALNAPPGWRFTGTGPSGGQGTSRLVENIATGERGFTKFLTNNRNRKARHRFHREVAAYETLLDAPNLPRLLAHNGDKFDTGNEQLWLILEPIDGCTLRDYITANGPVDLPTALSLIRPLLDTLAACHAEGTLHRDIKPGNVMLRDSDPAAPVLVDFGLSFNTDTDPDDLTRVNEDIGNRFLHLPEQSFGRHNPLGDIAQAVGLLIYALTGVEPRVFVDDQGRMPHQRPDTANRLASLADGMRLRALLAIFDKAFATRAISRFQTATELCAAIDALAKSQAGPEPRTLEDLMAQLDQSANTATHLELAHRRQLLNTLAAAPQRALADVISRYGLRSSQTGHSVDPMADPPTAQNSLALSMPGTSPTDPTDWVTYVYTLQGDDIVLHLDGLAGPMLWRGPDVDTDEHNNAVRAAALERLLPETRA
jgi:serine/threonine-protein kinase